MTIQQTIEKAIEGGWNDTSFAFLNPTEEDGYNYRVGKYGYSNEVFLDPLFWQSLGKAMGWNVCDICQDCAGNQALMAHHDFIDHLWEGKDAESFFNQL